MDREEESSRYTRPRLVNYRFEVKEVDISPLFVV